MTEGARRVAHATVIAVACAIVCGCASRGLVVLLPESDDRSTAVSLKQGDEDVLLDKPYAAANLTLFGPAAYQASEAEVQSRFGPALAAQPSRAASFTLYFVEGGDEFTAESKALVDTALSEIARRPVPDVIVVGHTDAVGTDAFNDALGQRRADSVRAALIALGVDAASVRAISRGKRALAVPTADGVAEPRNRRVEILVR